MRCDSGAIEFWMNRFVMNTDGISYLDLADAFGRHEWKSAINAYWSPLYPFILSLGLTLLKPSSYSEYPAVHLVNLLVFAGAAGAFHYFLSRLIRTQDRTVSTLSGWVPLPEWAILAIGYALFLWSSLKLITIGVVSPDMCVATFVYLGAGIVLDVHTRGHEFVISVCSEQC